MNDKVRTIGNEAFKNCAALQRIELPDSVVEIGSDAFSGCASLDEIIDEYLSSFNRGGVMPS